MLDYRLQMPFIIRTDHDKFLTKTQHLNLTKLTKLSFCMLSVVIKSTKYLLKCLKMLSSFKQFDLKYLFPSLCFLIAKVFFHFGKINNVLPFSKEYMNICKDI